MHSENAITIDGDLMTIYRLGAEIERWPDLLPHYRKVDVLWREDSADGSHTRCVAKMAAWRDGIPTSWMCHQERIASEPTIIFRHIAGFTRGMEVAWVFAENPDGTVTVRIIHDFSKGIPVAALDRFVSEKVVGQFFIDNIAGKTLEMVRLLAEADRMAHAGVPILRAEDLEVEGMGSTVPA
jgi:hypothetical protein